MSYTFRPKKVSLRNKYSQAWSLCLLINCLKRQINIHYNKKVKNKNYAKVLTQNVENFRDYTY
jgi:hypothetical protein